MIRNLTPHTITILAEPVKGSMYTTGDEVVVASFPSEGNARARMAEVAAPAIQGIPTKTTSYGEPEGLPEPVEGTYLIVSALTAAAAKAAGRDTSDLLSPGGLIRDAEGKILGASYFNRIG